MRGGTTGIEPEARLDGPQVADLTALEQSDQVLDLWVAAEGEPLHEEDPGRARSIEDHAGAGRVHGHWVLAQHVLARLGSEHGEFDVGGMWRRDIDELDGGIADERLIRRVRFLDPEFGGEGRGSVAVATPDGDEASEHRFLEGGREDVGDAPGPEDAPTRWCLHMTSVCAGSEPGRM